MNLISKYNVPAPRYTSYPTVPAWHRSPTQEEWQLLIKTSFNKTNSKNGISLYIHLPFVKACVLIAPATHVLRSTIK